MQRVGTLIDKLQEQYRRDGDVNALLLTAQMLVNELSTAIELKDDVPALAHASVLLPRQVRIEIPADIPADMRAIAAQADVEATREEAERQVFELEVEPQPEIDGVEVNDLPETEVPEEQAEYTDPVEAQATEEIPVPVANKPAASQPGDADFFNGQQWLFDMQTDVPTLPQQFMNQSSAEAESLNDKLKVEHKELGSVLKEAPIKDLKKAIGINDRYQFINELFRGDENMFERSLKTINAFNVYSEAEYWIKRELKLKLGWNEESEIVKHFDHLVKRRFL